MQLSTALLALAATWATAHPGHDATDEMVVRRSFLATQRSNLDHCKDTLKARGLKDRALQRRMATAEKLREKRGLKSMYCPSNKSQGAGY